MPAPPNRTHSYHLTFVECQLLLRAGQVHLRSLEADLDLQLSDFINGLLLFHARKLNARSPL